jgi:hypothetical protein
VIRCEGCGVSGRQGSGLERLGSEGEGLLPVWAQEGPRPDAAGQVCECGVRAARDACGQSMEMAWWWWYGGGMVVVHCSGVSKEVLSCMIEHDANYHFFKIIIHPEAQLQQARSGVQGRRASMSMTL